MKHVMNLMDRTGHTSITWDPSVPSEVELARSAFNDARTRGLHAFRIGAGGKQGSRITEFDPSIEKMVFAPQLQGG